MTQSPPENEDHRIAVARGRRERMRSRLLQATFAVYTADREGQASAVIDDVARAAEVSRATFYKYFSSLEEAAAELGRELADEMVEILDTIQDSITAPLMRASVGIQFFLWRAVDEPNWGHFVSRTKHVVSEDSAFMQRVTSDIADGRATGEMNFARLDAAVTLNNGALMDGIATLSRGVQDAAGFIEALTAMILLGFGVARPAAVEAQRWGSDFLKQEAPIHYAWWNAHR